MRRLSLAVALTAVLLVALALPAGGASAKTLPFQMDCGDGDVIFDIIAAEGSIVGFERETGRPVVFHGVQGEFIVTVEINDQFFDDVGFEEGFLKGKGKGLEFADCVANPVFEIENLAFTIGTDATGADISAFFDELGIDEIPPVFASGDVVRFVSTFEGDAQVQFPGT